MFWVGNSHGPKLSEDTPIKHVLLVYWRMFDDNTQAFNNYFDFSSFEQGLDLLLAYLAHTQATAYDKFSKIAKDVLWEQEAQLKQQMASNERRRKKQNTSDHLSSYDEIEATDEPERDKDSELVDFHSLGALG